MRLQLHPSPALSQKLGLVLTPHLRQALKLLQYSASDLEEEIARQLQDNPLLEQESHDDTTGIPAIPESGPPFEGTVTSHIKAGQHTDTVLEYHDGYMPGEVLYARPSLQDHLRQQLGYKNLDSRTNALLQILITELDDNGYLPLTSNDLDHLLPSGLHVCPQEWTIAIALLQSLDPAGVGARSLSECLTLQLRRLKIADGPAHKCALELAARHLPLLANGHFAAITKQIGCTPQTLNSARALLLKLNPKPGRSWSQNTAQYISPEVIVERSSDTWRARINPAAVPNLRVNTSYTHLFDSKDSQDDYAPLKEQSQKAQSFITGIEQRFATVLRIAQAVVEHQSRFFDQGDIALRPLLLRNIAQKLEMHESTVSRAVRHKYMQTPRGLLSFDYFFSRRLGNANSEELSTSAVRKQIQQLIIAENKAKPLSDTAIASKLALRGIHIARRTVSKYREQANIPAASQRRLQSRLENASP